jgi:hypothetical protein
MNSTTRLFLAVLAAGSAFGPSLAHAEPGVDEPISPYEDGDAPQSASKDAPRVATATPTRATVVHVPPLEAAAGRELRLVAIIDDAWVEDGVIVHYRPGGSDGAYAEAIFERSSAGGYFARIPAQSVDRRGIEYYISSATGDSYHFASPRAPHRVRVEPSSDRRWIEVERRRLGGRRYAIDSELIYHDFGDVHGSDRFAEGHVDWTYRLVDRLYAIKLGFAFLEGQTPSGTEEGAMPIDAGARYGYGAVRWRLRDKLWVDGKVMMGFGKEGFVTGIGGALTLGNDWRTAVIIGAEAMDELSYKAWITLQWDTVPGVLMSATAATTNQPGAQIDAGSYVEYELRLPIGDELELAGVANFGARGNRPGGFGGGLRTRYQF